MNSKPVVLFIIDSLEVGGAEKSLLDITHRFRRYTPVFLTLYKGNYLKPAFSQKDIKVHSLNQEKSINDRILINLIEEKIKIIDPSIIHATLLKSCLISRKLDLKSKSIILINSLVNNTYSLQRYKTLNPVRALKLFKTQLRDAISAFKVDCFFSNSQTIKNTTSKAVGINKKKIKVIYRGRDAEKFNIIGNQVLRRDIFKDADKVFLNVGRLIPQKGQKDALLAFAEYLNRVKTRDVLAIAGAGPNLASLTVLASSLGLQDRVIFLGRRNDIPELLAISDFFVFPSYYEGLPGSLIEAIFSKTPIITSDIPENLECVNKSTALIYKSGKIKDLTDKLIYARNNPHQMNSMIEKGYEYAMKNFRIQEIAEIYENHYDLLLD